MAFLAAAICQNSLRGYASLFLLAKLLNPPALYSKGISYFIAASIKRAASFSHS
ncbi:MAG: hypothetical protein RR543_03310 [Erysipelotrichales bacterium]